MATSIPSIPLNLVLGELFRAPVVAPPEPNPPKISEADIPKELAKQWKAIQVGHSKDIEKTIGTLLARDVAQTKKIKELEDDLAMWKAGRKDDKDRMEKMEKEKASMITENVSLSNNCLSDHIPCYERSPPIAQCKHPLVCCVLDFELDMAMDQFIPALFLRPDAGRAANRQLRTALLKLVPEGLTGVVNTLAFVFFSKSDDLIKDMMAEGLITSMAELDAFILAFNLSNPMYMLIDSWAPVEVVRQRERAIATILSRLPSCQKLLVGKWALEEPFADLACPLPNSNEKVPKKFPTFPPKLNFVQQFSDQYIPDFVLRREPTLVSLRGLLRRTPLRRGRGNLGPPRADFSKRIWAWDPPICLKHYLSPDKCRSENCPFCHAYIIPPLALAAIAYELKSTPCPHVNNGQVCPMGENNCWWGHKCRKGRFCGGREKGCRFYGEGMHPADQEVAKDKPISDWQERVPVGADNGRGKDQVEPLKNDWCQGTTNATKAAGWGQQEDPAPNVLPTPRTQEFQRHSTGLMTGPVVEPAVNVANKSNSNKSKKEKQKEKQKQTAKQQQPQQLELVNPEKGMPDDNIQTDLDLGVETTDQSKGIQSLVKEKLDVNLASNDFDIPVDAPPVSFFDMPKVASPSGSLSPPIISSKPATPIEGVQSGVKRPVPVEPLTPKVATLKSATPKVATSKSTSRLASTNSPLKAQEAKLPTPLMNPTSRQDSPQPGPSKARPLSAVGPTASEQPAEEEKMPYNPFNPFNIDVECMKEEEQAAYIKDLVDQGYWTLDPEGQPMPLLLEAATEYGLLAEQRAV